MMRQVWRYVLFGLGVVGIIWGIVLLFSQVWHALIVFALALLCLVATRLVGGDEPGAAPTTAHGTSTSEADRPRTSAVQEFAVPEQADQPHHPDAPDESARDGAGNDAPSARTVSVMPAEESPDDEGSGKSDEDDEW